jgi:hypothetical protein
MVKMLRRSGSFKPAMVACRISTAANFWKKIPENPTGTVRDIRDLH